MARQVLPGQSGRRPADLLRQRRIRLAIVLPLLMLVIGVLGFWWLGAPIDDRNWSLLDALYMTVITVSTVGYGETQPLGVAGRVFNIFFIILSFGSMGYSVSVLTSVFLEGEIHQILRGRRMDKQIDHISDHVIVCGLGRTGRSVAEELTGSDAQVVAIDNDATKVEEFIDDFDLPALVGDATDDGILRRAGIERAKGLITVLHEDKDNVFVVLSARALRPDLHLVSRLNDEHNEAKLQKAGADQVVSPNAIGGYRMASLMIRRPVLDFVDAMAQQPGDWTIESLPIARGSRMDGVCLADLRLPERYGLLVVGIRHPSGEHSFNPHGTSTVEAGDRLLLIGQKHRIRELFAED